MSKSAKKAADQAEREKVHKRYSNRREPDVIYPAKKQVDFYDADIHQRVAVYVRVSTDNLGQETSYELQKNYYEEFVLKHPNWKLVKIYADKGISGTSTKHRVELNQMLTDSRAGKIDLIITKSVSRLARNTVDCITMVRNLAELRNPVGVFFESECIFSLNEDTNMPLSFLASIAENESRIRSRSMEVSLAQRLNGGLPLTPKLLGYSHDADGKLVINPDEAPTVKLIFYMYLSGYSSSHIAKTLEALGKRTFLGNSKWTSGTVIQVLRNERHCGDVLTRKTFTPDVISHKSKKNRGERQQSLYKGEHEAIVSRDDYIAVQHMINNAKYGGKSILPELRVIESGVLKGFVTISPKWAGFKAADYLQASTETILRVLILLHCRFLQPASCLRKLALLQQQLSQCIGGAVVSSLCGFAKPIGRRFLVNWRSHPIPIRFPKLMGSDGVAIFPQAAERDQRHRFLAGICVRIVQYSFCPSIKMCLLIDSLCWTLSRGCRWIFWLRLIRHGIIFEGEVRLREPERLSNDHIAYRLKLFLLGQGDALRRRLVIVDTELLSKILPQRIGGRHTLVLRQLIHDLVHDTLDAGRQVTVDFLAIDFLKPLGKVCHQQLQFDILQCPRRHLFNKGRHLFFCFLL